MGSTRPSLILQKADSYGLRILFSLFCLNLCCVGEPKLVNMRLTYVYLYDRTRMSKSEVIISMSV